MLETVKEFVFSNYTTWIGINAYWIPILICLIGEFGDCVDDYKRDLENSTKKYFSAELTVGVILGRILLSIVPVVNFFHALQYVFQFGDKFVKYLGKVLDFPLVRHRPKNDN